MVRRDPDDIITALSKNLKAEQPQALRLTFKRGGLWKPEFAKAHSRIAKKNLKQQIKKTTGLDQEKEWPLLIRYRQNSKNEEGQKLRKRLNCPTKIGKSSGFLDSLISVFRVNFFKKKGENEKKQQKGATKANPLSKTSIRRKQKTARNQQRRKKRNQLRRAAQQKNKQISKS